MQGRLATLMLTFLLTALQFPGVTLYEFFISYVIVNWTVRYFFSLKYRPISEPFEISTAVLIPVLNEELDIFESVLKRVKDAKPDEFLVIINGPRNLEIESICSSHGVAFEWITKEGKRYAIARGLEIVKSELVVLVDSDTFWQPDTLFELKKAFADEKVGGATTRQTIRNEADNVLTRWAAWIEEIRNEYSFPAMGSQSQVGCLPGRTIAFRRQILVDSMPEFLNDKFLGVHLEISDDRALTNYTLKAGYKTVFQSTSKVETIAPTSYGRLVKQQLRWARGSQYNTLRMMPWMLRNSRLLAFLYATDILLPIFLLSVGITWALKSILKLENIVGVWDLPIFLVNEAVHSVALSILILVGLVIVVAALFTASRYLRILLRDRKQLMFLPFFVLINFFVLVPLRLLGFWWMGYHSDWGTREGYEKTVVATTYNYQKHIPQLFLIIFLSVVTYISVGAYF